ncbi:glycosyl hydrolase family 8 [Bacteroides sp. Marseille-P3684]|uniref:glycosyl hydrolase family 8 n=1 Tax=Bacteroides sp. Marseille-P3684 TaxID=2086579 RepID=UPI000D0B9A04|nr:glycosyl hydrolase family 8 [Bacteroides sp. Marseille-P3684]
MNTRTLLTTVALCLATLSAHAGNLFTSLLGKSEAEVEARLQQVWNHFFTPADLDRYEAPGETSVYYETADGLAFIMDTGNNDVRSEGMSYGMMLSVQLDHRKEFDKLWGLAKKYMAYAPGSAWDGYFCWQCRPDGTKLGGSNASDGEAYFVTALFLAAERWGEPRYADEANAILTKVMNKDGERTGVYNLYNKENGLITFVPDRMGHGFTDPSYQLPAFLDKWAQVASADRPFWERAATEARRHLIASAHPETGLYPDYSEYDGRAYRWPHAGYDTSIYMYDAIRCAMNVGMDYYLWGKDKANQTEVMARLLTFFRRDGFRHAHFALDGSDAFGEYTQGMAGANAVGAVALADSDSPEHRELAREYVQRLWDAQPPTGKFRYYEGLVYFLSMLHVSGHFALNF